MSQSIRFLLLPKQGSADSVPKVGICRPQFMGKSKTQILGKANQKPKDFPGELAQSRKS